MKNPKMIVYAIFCNTGCSCCYYENHYRGPYRTKKIAKKRIEYFLSENSDFWPCASQYAKRGIYEIVPITLEILPDNRVIVDGYKIHESFPPFIFVERNGFVKNTDDEVWGI